jgi:type II secretory pathway pseudopilin PulG
MNKLKYKKEYYIFSVSHHRRGFTLVEILLYISIASVMLLVTTLFLQTLLESRIKNQTIAEVEQQGLQVMQMITQKVRNAENITIPTQGANDSSLTLDVLDLASDPTIFDLSSGVIRTTEGTSSAVSLTNSRVVASSLVFENLSGTDTPGIVRIEFIITHINPSGRNEYDFSKTFQTSASLRYPQ